MRSHGVHPRAGEGEEESPSLPALYREYGRLVRSVVFRIAGSRDLDDLVQDTFVRIWRGLESYRRESNVKTWIYRIAVNTAVDHHRKNRDRKRESALPSEIAGDDPMRERIHRDLVQKGLAGLSVRHRTVLVLHCMEGLSVGEIAEVTGSWKGTVKSRLFYARKEMSRFLQKNGVDL